MSTRVAAAIRQHTGRQYEIGSVISGANGITFDSWYEKWNAMHAVLIELTGTFTSPTSMIRPNGQDMWAGYMAFGEGVLADPGTSPGPRPGPGPGPAPGTPTPRPARDCVRNLDCSVNPWCNAPAHDTWCPNHPANACPWPQCTASRADLVA